MSRTFPARSEPERSPSSLCLDADSPFCPVTVLCRSRETDPLARRLVAELAALVGDRPVQWVALDDVMRALGVGWEAAEEAADFAAAQGWVEHRTPRRAARS